MKPTISEVVKYLREQGYVPTVGHIKPRPESSYRSYQRNLARRMRKLVK